MSKLALVTGITGQDGSYLAEYLLEKDYKVVGLYRRNSNNNFSRIKHLSDNKNLILEEFDITDPSGCLRLFSQYQPSECYNLAAQSHVGTSFKQPTTTFEINSIGVINMLESIRLSSPETKFYQASTSEMFGSSYSKNYADNVMYQDESTPFLPQSPYAIAKLASHRMVQIYRQSYNLYACCGILFNHESPRRGENFVTRKITRYIGELASGLLTGNNYRPLKLGNIYSHRDWGHAKDFVRAMYLMLQQESPDDFVISTGTSHSVKDFLEISFKLINTDYNNHIEIDPDLYRPCEVDYLKGVSDKAQSALGWKPEISFEKLVSDMVYSDIELAKLSHK